jgi:hypothetical protein
MVSTGTLSVFSLMPVVVGSDGIYDSCGASGTSVDVSVSELDDCYVSGHILPLPSFAQGFPTLLALRLSVQCWRASMSW